MMVVVAASSCPMYFNCQQLQVAAFVVLALDNVRYIAYSTNKRGKKCYVHKITFAVVREQTKAFALKIVSKLNSRPLVIVVYQFRNFLPRIRLGMTF